MSFTSFMIMVKTWGGGAVASPKGREVNWNTCDLWQNLRYFLEFGWMGKRPIGLSMIPIPLEPGRS